MKRKEVKVGIKKGRLKVVKILSTEKIEVYDVLNKTKRVMLIDNFCRRNCNIERHGLRGSRIYTIWKNMKNRCDNKNVPTYKYYGAKGITYKKSWKSFINFYNDMKAGYSDELSLDRISPFKNYTKINCRWATVKEQANNKRGSKLYKGENMRDASKRLGGNKDLVFMRVKNGVPFNVAFTEKPYRGNKFVK